MMDINRRCLEILNQIGPVEDKIKRVNMELEFEIGISSARKYMAAVLNRNAGIEVGLKSDPVLAEIWEETERQLAESEQRKLKQGEKAEHENKQAVYHEKQEQDGDAFDAMTDVVDLFYQPPTPVGDEEREAHPEEKYYISDVIDMTELETGKLNLIFSPPGTGKTTFIEGELKRYADEFAGDLLYLAPQTSLVDQLKFRGRPRRVPLSKGGYYVEWAQDGITAMTYSAFGYRIEKARREGCYCSDDWWAKDSIICLDELSQAVHQSFYDSKGNNPTALALKELVVRAKDKSNIVLTLSATPRASIDYFRFWNETQINAIKSTLGLRGYQNENTVDFTDFENVLHRVGRDERGLVYTKQIRQVRKAVDLLRSRGINAIGIWSLNSQDNPMNNEQLSARNCLVKNECYPDDLQVLVVNGAYETGLNIRPEKTRLDYVVVNDTNEETITQARGRYRGDLKTLYQKTTKDKGEERYIDPSVIDPYLGVKLYGKTKDELRKRLGFKDERGRLVGWKQVVNELRRNYLVLDNKKDSIGRYSLIRKLDAPEDC